GKELVARALHDESSRAAGPFIVLDCGALSRDLAEASILGHKKGSFTGAIADRPGAFEEANGGTLFLDEIGELPLELQPKLLRVLDRREVQRVGESQTRPVDVRVVAATHRDLRKMVGTGQFREDLYFRLSVMNVELPSLRERGDDVLLIADHFREEFSRARNERLSFGEDVVATLRKNPWPGNVRQLRNTIERACYLAKNGVITPADLHMGGRATAPIQPRSEGSGELPERLYSVPFKVAKQEVIDGFERAYLERLIARTDGNLSRAAGEAEITRYYLRELLKRLGMHKSSKLPAGDE
ncbi:MAG: sigma 54-interacting transcriptional regulator, partial [Nannocystaceae bacterium]